MVNEQRKPMLLVFWKSVTDDLKGQALKSMFKEFEIQANSTTLEDVFGTEKV